MERDNKAVSGKRPWGCGLLAIHQMPRINYTVSTGAWTTKRIKKEKKTWLNQEESLNTPSFICSE